MFKSEVVLTEGFYYQILPTLIGPTTFTSIDAEFYALLTYKHHDILGRPLYYYVVGMIYIGRNLKVSRLAPTSENKSVGII